MDPSGARVSGAYSETIFASGEVHDTERPPPMFTPEEVNTLEPVVRTLCDADELQPRRMVPRWDTPEQLRWEASAEDRAAWRKGAGS